MCKDDKTEMGHLYGYRDHLLRSTTNGDWSGCTSSADCTDITPAHAPIILTRLAHSRPRPSCTFCFSLFLGMIVIRLLERTKKALKRRPFSHRLRCLLSTNGGVNRTLLLLKSGKSLLFRTYFEPGQFLLGITMIVMVTGSTFSFGGEIANFVFSIVNPFRCTKTCVERSLVVIPFF